MRKLIGKTTAMTAAWLMTCTFTYAESDCESYACKMEEEYTTCKYAFQESEKIELCYQMSLLEVCDHAVGDDHDTCLSAWKSNTHKFWIDADWAKPPEKQSLEKNFLSIEKSGYSTETDSVHKFTIGCSAENIFIAFETPYEMPIGSTVYGSFDRTGAREIEWNATEDSKLIMITGEEADDIFWEIGLEDTFAMVTETEEGQYITQFKSGNYDDVSSDLDQCTDE